MTDDDDKTAKRQTGQTASDLSTRTSAPDSSSVNPYQAPAYHPHERGPDSPIAGVPGPAFWITAAVLITLGLVATVMTQGAALPLPFAVVLGTMRASALFACRKSSPYSRIPPVLLLITSTFLTLLLMFCCVIAFVTICTSGALVVGDRVGNGLGILSWTAVSATVALVAFVLLFIRSMKWGV